MTNIGGRIHEQLHDKHMHQIWIISGIYGGHWQHTLDDR